MKAVTVKNEINNFLKDKLKELCATVGIEYEFHYQSNLIAETNTQKLRVYFNSRVIREEQDTLAVDVEDLGRIRYTTNGVYVLNFFAPRNLPMSYDKMESIAQQLKNELRKARFECLWVRHITATPYPQENNSYRYDVTFSYEFDEII